MGNLERSVTQAVITLGGKGTRLSEITKEIPKPLWPVNGIHTLERTTNLLTQQGVKEFIWIVNFKKEMFKDEADRLSKLYCIKINIFNEILESGEAGSLFNLRNKLNDDFLFVNGDIVFDIDLKRFYNFHIRNSAEISFVTHLTSHPNDSDCISESQTLRINKYKLKTDKINQNNFFLGNAGLALLTKKVVQFICSNTKNNQNKLSLFKDFIVYAHERGCNVFSYNSSEYLKDMGTPDRLRKVENDLNQKLVENSSYRVKQKVLFLDRDNTLINCPKEKYIIDDNFTIMKNRLSKIIEISKDYNFVLIITNQPQISMGIVDYQTVIDINTKLILNCQKLGLDISAAYICPHHPHDGYKDEVTSLKVNCFCRKPLPGMLFESAINRNISLQDSLLIGDSWRDKLCAEFSNTQFLNVANLDSSS